MMSRNEALSERLMPIQFITTPENAYPRIHARLSRHKVVYSSVGNYFEY